MHKLSSIVCTTSKSSSVRNGCAIKSWAEQPFCRGCDQVVEGFRAVMASDKVGDEASWPHFRPKNLWTINTCQISRARQENTKSELNYLIIV